MVTSVLAVCQGDIPKWIFIPAMVLLALIVRGMAFQQQDDADEIQHLRDENERLKRSR